jgi:hypothetical protein
MSDSIALPHQVMKPRPRTTRDRRIVSRRPRALLVLAGFVAACGEACPAAIATSTSDALQAAYA